MNIAFKACLSALAALAIPATGMAQSTPEEDGNQLANPRSSFAGTGGGAWHANVERTERGHIIGNPQAEASLIEFISYTCGHCASFEREGGGALDLAVLAPGHMTVEIRSVIRNPVDLTISMLVACGPADRFKDRHRMFLARQTDWMQKAMDAPQSQRASWASGNRTARISMAAALDLDDMLAERGTSRADITRCLSDDALARTLVQNGQSNADEFAYTGTPSFALDGELLDGVHSWSSLYPVLEERFRPDTEQESAF